MEEEILSAQPNRDSLLIGITLKGDEVKRFQQFKEEDRHRTNAATGYALLLAGLEANEARRVEPAPVGAS